MKASTKNYLRGLRHQLGSLIGVIVIVAVAVTFYTTLKTVVTNYDQSTTTYFTDYKFPDAIVSGVNFNESDAASVRAVDGVVATQLRTAYDVKSGDNTLRIRSYDTQNSQVNAPYVYEGSAPRNADECLVTRKYAESNNIHTGDRLALADTTFSDICTVSGLATAPEQMYLWQSAAQPVADKKTFATVYVDTVFAERNALPFSELAVRYDTQANVDDTTEKVMAALPTEKLLGVTKHDSIFSYQAHRSDIEMFELFAYLFPIVFFVIAAIVIFVSQRCAIIRDRSQIGIMKAMGCSGGQIMRLYVLGAVMTVTFGVMVGFGATLLLGSWIVDIFQGMFEAPFLSFDGAPKQLLIPAVISLAICIVPTIFAVWQTARLKPATAMRPVPPAAGRDILLQKTPLWKSFSFNTRYGFKAALRNRGRFIAMVCGIVAMLALLTLSFGFRDSFNNISTAYYDIISDYDVTVQTEPTSIETAPAFLSAVSVTAYEPVFVMSATITHDGVSKDVLTHISSDPLKTHAFTSVDGGAIDVADGLVVPRAFAQKLGIQKGDTVTVATTNGLLDGRVTIADISNQDLSFRAIMTYDTARTNLGFQHELYNFVYARVMKEKMAKSREKGRGGWDDPAVCKVEDLGQMLIDHISMW
jgi:putative ABC transport system permease protein